MKLQKRKIHLKTSQDSNYWHFPCVMLWTLPSLVQLQYILQYVKNKKNTSNVKVAIIQLSRWQYWRQQQQNRRFPSCFSCLNMHNLFCKGNYWMSEAWVWQIHSRRDSSRLKENKLQLDIFSAFYVLFHLRLLEALLQQSGNLCAHKLNGCHWNNQYYRGLKPFRVGGTVEKVSKEDLGFFFFNEFLKKGLQTWWVIPPDYKILTKNGWRGGMGSGERKKKKIYQCDH